MRIFENSDWDEDRIRRDEIDGDVIAYCASCGIEIDLNDGAIFECYRCGTFLRKKDKEED